MLSCIAGSHCSLTSSLIKKNSWYTWKCYCKFHVPNAWCKSKNIFLSTLLQLSVHKKWRNNSKITKAKLLNIYEFQFEHTRHIYTNFHEPKYYKYNASEKWLLVKSFVFFKFIKLRNLQRGSCFCSSFIPFWCLFTQILLTKVKRERFCLKWFTCLHFVQLLDSTLYNYLHNLKTCNAQITSIT